MKIVITDKIFLKENHVRRLKQLGELIVYKDLPITEEMLIKRLEDADIAIVGFCKIPASVINLLVKLKMFSLWATGYDCIDINAATKKGFIITNVPNYSSKSVAEHVFALILTHTRKILQTCNYVTSGDSNWQLFKGQELSGKTIGVIGTGAIGTSVIKIAKGFGLNVVSYTKHPSSERAEKLGINYMSLEDVLKESDFITIHVPLNIETEKLIGTKELRIMKRESVLVNTSRSKVIDEDALLEILKNNKIACACLDVFSDEKFYENYSLLDNVIITPHIAFNTIEALSRCTDICIANISAFLDGKPENVVNRDVF